MFKIQRFLFVFIFTAFSTLGASAKAETIRTAGQNDRHSNPSDDALASFLGNPGHSVPATAVSSVSDPLGGVFSAGSGRQEASAESKLGWALWEMTQKTSETARAVKDTVKTTITDYVKDKQKQLRQQDLVEKFHTNLQYVSANLHLAPRDQQELTDRVQHVYIEDAESGRYELDSLHFSQLPYIVRKEYADMVLARTQNGEAETYHLNGALKTRWNLKNGQANGPVVTYYENGDINFIDVFKGGRKIRRTKYDTEGKLVFEQNYDYSVPDEKNSNEKETKASEKEMDVIGSPEPEASEKPTPSVQPKVAAEEAEVLKPQKKAKSENTSGAMELPPQASTSLIEV